ncbi:hypothetical protein C8R46DRAFT_387584 [Mycena filopes]|nr:hypothetical protein C8R46DRAFT_387584 [Mycena filopes]
MSEAPPSATRKRTHEQHPEATPAAEPTPVRSSKIWMPYGDIILQAESTQFRVNRDVLARQSSVFKDMFSVPQPPDEPTIEGCPIVHVSDTARDWELLLDVLYHPFQSSISRPVAVVASMLRLGRKYDIPESREDALSRLHYEYPTSLEAWVEVPPKLSKIQPQKAVQIDLLNLVIECGVQSCVPTLGFACLNYNLETLIAGVKRDDGSTATLSVGLWLKLVVALVRILFYQRQSLAWLKEDGIVPHTSCKLRKACERQKRAINQSVFWAHDGDDRRHETSYIIDVWDHVNWSGKLCEVCETGAKDHYEAARQKGWELLPTFFGLPEWKDLIDDVE